MTIYLTFKNNSTCTEVSWWPDKLARLMGEFQGHSEFLEDLTSLPHA